MPKKTPSPGWRRGAGDPPRTYRVLRVNLRLTLAGVGLCSFGPNPTANPVGAEEGGSQWYPSDDRSGGGDVRGDGSAKDDGCPDQALAAREAHRGGEGPGGQGGRGGAPLVAGGVPHRG